MLSLRTANGVNLNDYFKTFNSDFKKDFENAIKNNLSYLDINEILSVTSNKNEGIGGIDTKGVARRIY